MGKQNHHISQRILLLFLILFVPIFLVKKYQPIARKQSSMKYHQEIPVETLQNFDNSRHKKVVVIVTLNDKSSLNTHCLSSIFSQTYDNFDVALISDQKDVSKECQNYHRMAYYQTSQGKTTDQLIYEIISKYSDDSIVVQLDATESLDNSEVLSKVNVLYKNPNVWLLYSGKDRGWELSYFKTYYAGLGKQALTSQKIKPEHLIKTWSRDHIQYYPKLIQKKTRTN